MGLTVAYPAVLPVALVLGVLVLGLSPGVGRPARAVAVLLLAGLAAVLSEYGVAARSLYAFHALCDLLLITDAGWILETALRRVDAPAATRTWDL